MNIERTQTDESRTTEYGVSHDDVTPLLTVAEAAARLRRCEKTVRRYCQDGRLAHYREDDGRILIPEWSIEDYFGACFVSPSCDAEEAITIELTSRSRVRSACPSIRSVVDYDNRLFDREDAA